MARHHIKPSADNRAAWLVKRNKPLEVSGAPAPTALPGRIVVQVGAVALNPVDWMIQAAGQVMYPWLKTPSILGSDVAGTVVAVGDGVHRFSTGDRVLGLAVGTDKAINNSAESAFQRHVVLREALTSPIPDSMAFEDAAVLPLGLSTAACGLFQKKHLGLRHPSTAPSPTGQTVLIWGGSTSVGSNAIQLAVAAGYEVVSTASPKNWEYLRGLGAQRVFDYRSPSVVQELVAHLRGKRIAGALAIGEGSAERCIEVVRACDGQKVVAMASAPVSFAPIAQGASSLSHLPRIMARMIGATAVTQVRSRLHGIRVGFIWGSSLQNDEVGKVIFADFLPRALAEGTYVAAPAARVVGHGLDAIEPGLREQLAGTSAAKVVVSLSSD